MKIAQINASDEGGGAARVALNLHLAARRHHQSRLFVGVSGSSGLGIERIEHLPFRSAAARPLLERAESFGSRFGHIRGIARLQRLVEGVAEPRRRIDRWRGIDDFDFPGTWELAERLIGDADVVHLHNLHGGYFDLRVLPRLTSSVPCVLTMHDAWLTTGHCAHSLDCDRWLTGCGQCPYLDIYPAVTRDSTHENWSTKRALYAESKLYLATPSQWLMQRAERSILWPAVQDARVIPYGVDTEIFFPSSADVARSALGLPLSKKIILTAGHLLLTNQFKDFPTFISAIGMLSDSSDVGQLLVLALGGETESLTAEGVEVRVIPYETDPHKVADYYRAADVYVQSSRVDTFPNSVLEAMACGTPVIGSSVGGIAEQLNPDARTETRDGMCDTGFLFEPGEARQLAEQLRRLLADDSIRRKMADAAARVARSRYTLEREFRCYMDWYADILASEDESVNPSI